MYSYCSSKLLIIPIQALRVPLNLIEDIPVLQFLGDIWKSVMQLFTLLCYKQGKLK